MAAAAPRSIVRGGRTGLGVTGLWGELGWGKGKQMGLQLSPMRHRSSAQLPAHTEGWEGSVGSPGYSLTPPDPPGGTGRGSTRADTHLSAQHVGSAPRGAQFPPRAPSAVAPGSPGHRGAWLRHPTLPRGFVPCCRGVQRGGAAGVTAGGGAPTARHAQSPLGAVTFMATPQGGTAVPRGSPRSRALHGEGPPRVAHHPRCQGRGGGGGALSRS